MADNSTGGSNNALYLIVGGLVVAMAVGAFAIHGGYIGGHGSSTTTEKTTVSAPALTAPAATTTTTTTTKP